MKIIFHPLLLLLTAFLNANFTCIAQPVASFSLDRYNICSGTTFQMINTSTMANKYVWMIEGTVYSNARDTLANLSDSCYDRKEISLIAIDTVSGMSDTARAYTEIIGACYFHWTGTFLSCPGDTISLGIFPEEIATRFTLSAPVTVLAGCETCPFIEFIQLSPSLIVDRRSTYYGDCSEITTYEYFCQTTTVETVENSSFEIFPNPAMDQVKVHIRGRLPESLSLIDLNGQCLFTKKITEPLHHLELKDYPDGVYFLRTQYREGTFKIRRLILLK